MTSKNGSKILSRLKKFSDDLKVNDRISNKYTCRTIKLDLQPESYQPEDVKEARSVLGVSQAIFAQFLGVSIRTLQDWEQGQNRPMDVACRLMDEIRRDPIYWQDRLKELSVDRSSEKEEPTTC